MSGREQTQVVFLKLGPGAADYPQVTVPGKWSIGSNLNILEDELFPINQSGQESATIDIWGRVGTQIRGISPIGRLGSYGNWPFRAVLVILATYGVAQPTASPQDSGTASADLGSMDLVQLMDIKVQSNKFAGIPLSTVPRVGGIWSPSHWGQHQSVVRQGLPPAQLGLPGFGFHSIDCVPVQQGRTVYAGLEFSLGKH